MIEGVLTIGVYGFAESSFVDALESAHVDVLVDIRSRRGVRGADYAFANANRLIAILGNAGIRYVHAKELAPSQAVRDEQRRADHLEGVAKRGRMRLAAAFVAAYERECLSRFDTRSFVEKYLTSARFPAFLCVERDPSACHRSLVADRVAMDLSVPRSDLQP